MNNNPQITVFTAAYNRANLLPRCYESLKKQTCKNFVWLIVDDGSIDNTAELVSCWLEQENSFEIRYHYKENGGLYTAYNTAVSLLDTELMVGVDSDDCLVPNAISNILSFWNSRDNKMQMGIIGLDEDFKGNLIGSPLPNLETINLASLIMGKYGVGSGDKTLVVRRDLYQKVYPQPEFSGEKNFDYIYTHLKIAAEYDMFVMNDVLTRVDYQQDGMSAMIFRQYMNSPKSFQETRRLFYSLKDASPAWKIKQCIHYVSSSLFARDSRFLKTAPNKWLTVLMLPFGILLSFYIAIKGRTK